MLRDVVGFIMKETIEVMFEKETMERLAWEKPKNQKKKKKKHLLHYHAYKHT